MPSIEELRARFQRDRFATELTGADIREAEPGRAVCALSLRPVLSLKARLGSVRPLLPGESAGYGLT